MQPNKLKSGMRNCTETTLNVSLNVISDFTDDKHFPHKLLLTGTQVSRFRKGFANGSSANANLSKTQLSI